jgi:hypothetical protein
MTSPAPPWRGYARIVQREERAGADEQISRPPPLGLAGRRVYIAVTLLCLIGVVLVTIGAIKHGPELHNNAGQQDASVLQFQNTPGKQK